MDNPLVQPDPGLFIWTILTFLVLLGLVEASSLLAQVPRGERRRWLDSTTTSDDQRSG